MLLKGKRTEAWIEWLGQRIHPSWRQSWKCPVLSKFFLPQLEPFDELKDPLDHLNTFKMTLGLQQPLNEILYHSFPTTLKGATREWFTKLPTSSIDSFEQLGNSFLRHFIGGQHLRRPADHLLTIRQREKETLRSYMKRFTYDLRVSFSYCLMVSKWSAGLFGRCPPTKCCKKALPNCSKLSMNDVGNFVNHSLVALLRVVGKE